MTENWKKILSWTVLLAFFIAAIVLSPNLSARMLLGLLAVYVLFSYGRKIWREWEK